MSNLLVPAAVAFAQNRFAGATRSIVNPVNAVVGVVATPLLLNNPDRLFWMIFNRSPNSIDLDFSPGVLAGLGIPIAPNGGYVSMDVRDDGEAVINPVWGIASASLSNVYVLEVRRV